MRRRGILKRYLVTSVAFLTIIALPVFDKLAPHGISDSTASDVVTGTGQPSRSSLTETNQWEAVDFHIIVLTMNRADTLGQLLRSLERSKFGGDRIKLTIRFDFHADQVEALKVAEKFHFPHGHKVVYRSEQSLGLARAWFTAWHPESLRERAIILEDDIVMSPDWYLWLKEAWDRYGSTEGIAGVSLQRQVLVPKQPHEQREIVNSHQPFLFSLLGSIAFSPSAKVWLEFRVWLDSVDLDTFDVSTPGLITSEWWNVLDKRNMWTQHFIYFSLLRDLYTMYINLPAQQTLAAHLRAKGAHYDGDQGPDFQVGFMNNEVFPPQLQRYGWNGKLIPETHDRYPENGIDILGHLLLAGFQTNSKKFGHVLFLPSDEHGIVPTLSLLNDIENDDRYNQLIIICSTYSVARRILEIHPAALVITQNMRNQDIPAHPHRLYNLTCSDLNNTDDNYVAIMSKCHPIWKVDATGSLGFGSQTFRYIQQQLLSRGTCEIRIFGHPHDPFLQSYICSYLNEGDDSGRKWHFKQWAFQPDMQRNTLCPS